MQAVSAWTSVGSTAGNMPIRSWLRPSLRYGSVSTIPFARKHLRDERGVDALGEVDRADDERALGTVRDERCRVLRRLGPAIQVVRRASGPPDAPVQPAVVEHPLDLVGEQEQRCERRRVVGLVLGRVVERGGERQEGRDPPIAAGDLGDPLLGRRTQQREPQAAVGGEALLRREVVRVGAAGVERQSAGARRRVDDDERVVGAGGPAHRNHHAGRRLVVRPGDDVGPRIGGRSGRVARLGRHDDRVGEERRLGRRLRELRGELPVGEVQRAVAHEAERGRVPECGRAAVAERHLVAVREREQLAQPFAHARDELLHRRLAVGRAEHRAALGGEPRQRLGTHLGRPAAEAAVERLQVVGDHQFGGDRGVWRHGSVLAVMPVGAPVAGRGQAGRWEVPRRAAVMRPRRFPVVEPTRTPVATVGRV